MFRIRLKELREAMGISQAALAKNLGLAQSTVGNWEAGIREPDYEMTQRLADYFGVSVDYLIGHDEVKAVNRIAELRKQNGLSQDELANYLGIAQSTLSQYENESRIPPSKFFLRLAEFFKVSPNYIQGIEDSKAEFDTIYNLQKTTKVKSTADIDDVNISIQAGWKLLHVGTHSEIGYDGSGYSQTEYTLGWFGDPNAEAAKRLAKTSLDNPNDYYL